MRRCSSAPRSRLGRGLDVHAREARLRDRAAVMRGPPAVRPAREAMPSTSRRRRWRTGPAARPAAVEQWGVRARPSASMTTASCSGSIPSESATGPARSAVTASSAPRMWRRKAMARSWTRIRSAGRAGSPAHKARSQADSRSCTLEPKRPRLARVVTNCPAIARDCRRFSPPGPDQAHLRPTWTTPANPPKTTTSSNHRALRAMARPGLEPGDTTIFSRGPKRL